MDQLDAMRAFVAVANAGSFSAAARRLGVPVPSLSRKLAALEGHLGARLLARTTRKMALTEAGRRYLETCQRLVAEIEAADRSVSRTEGEPQGLLSVTASIVFGRLHLLPVVVEFLRAHRAVDIRVLLSDRNIELIEEGVDVAVRIGALPDSALIGVRVGATRRIACASPAYLRERGTPARPEDLAAHDCISMPVLSSPERWSFGSKRGQRSVAVRSRLTVSTAEAAIDAAAAGLGVARVLCYQAAAAIAAGRLTRILERFEPPPLPIHILHAEGRAPRAKVRAFVALASTRLRAALR